MRISRSLNAEFEDDDQPSRLHPSPPSFFERVNKFHKFLYRFTTHARRSLRGGIGLGLDPIEMWCRGRESNPHGPCSPMDFESIAYPSSATPAKHANTIIWKITMLLKLLESQLRL